MCLNPISRPNPNLGCKPSSGYMFMKDLKSKFIEVPCGHCAECVALRQNQLAQRVENESKYAYLYFCTLTYDEKHLPRYRVLVPTVERARPDGSRENLVPITPSDAEAFLQDESFDTPDRDPFSVLPEDSALDKTDLYAATHCKEILMPYADIHHIQLLLKNLRDNNPVGGRYLRYLAVSELGKTRARPHFHILFFVEKLPGDDKFTPLNLERPLREYVKAHWAVNVGTRKNPIWEPRFTYRKRFYGGRLYQNFDLHYVNPNTTTDGVLNVAYYVTKYMMKPSAKEQARQQFLKLNLDENQYETTWKRIKCRLLISKGLGLDARFETLEETQYVPLPLDVYAAVLDADDLPSSTRPDAIPVVKKRRVMIPNFELVQWIRDTAARGLKEKNPHPIYVDLNGNHKPLARYYQDKPYIFTPMMALDFWLNASYDQVYKPNYDPEKIKRQEKKHEERMQTVDKKGNFDFLSAALDSALFGSVPDSGCSVRGRYDIPGAAVYRLGTDKL